MAIKQSPTDQHHDALINFSNKSLTIHQIFKCWLICKKCFDFVFIDDHEQEKKIKITKQNKKDKLRCKVISPAAHLLCIERYIWTKVYINTKILDRFILSKKIKIIKGEEKSYMTKS